MTLPELPSNLSPGWLAPHIAALLPDAGEIEPTDSLILYGLDSLAVMKVAAALKQRGVVVTFEELAQQPTLTAWAALIASRHVD